MSTCDEGWRKDKYLFRWYLSRKTGLFWALLPKFPSSFPSSFDHHFFVATTLFSGVFMEYFLPVFPLPSHYGRFLLQGNRSHSSRSSAGSSSLSTGSSSSLSSGHHDEYYLPQHTQRSYSQHYQHNKSSECQAWTYYYYYQHNKSSECLTWTMDFYIIHGLILCLLPTLKKGQNLFSILVSSLQLNIFITV